MLSVPTDCSVLQRCCRVSEKLARPGMLPSPLLSVRLCITCLYYRFILSFMVYSLSNRCFLVLHNVISKALCILFVTPLQPAPASRSLQLASRPAPAQLQFPSSSAPGLLQVPSSFPSPAHSASSRAPPGLLQSPSASLQSPPGCCMRYFSTGYIQEPASHGTRARYTERSLAHVINNLLC